MFGVEQYFLEVFVKSSLHLVFAVVNTAIIEKNLKDCNTVKFIIERFSNDCQKTKTKAITPTNHNRGKQRDEPIKIPSN